MPRILLSIVWILCGQAILPTVLLGLADPSPSGAVVQAAGSEIQVAFPNERLRVSTQNLLEWVKSAAGAVVGYYGRFPVPHLSLRIRAGRGAGIGHGVTYADGGGLITVAVGREAEVDALKNDWVLTHEMIHLAFPSMAKNHHWIEEGISTYVEPVARAQAGQLPVGALWRQFILDMPQGEPGAGDHGLDNTPTWGRTYWGGALFCLVAEVKIRERTQNRKGLQDALRAILDQGGTITQDWDIEKALAIGDQATGTGVLQSLYKKMRDRPAPVDLGRLWRKLGVALIHGEVVFNDHAADASIRKSIISPR